MGTTQSKTKIIIVKKLKNYEKTQNYYKVYFEGSNYSFYKIMFNSLFDSENKLEKLLLDRIGKICHIEYLLTPYKNRSIFPMIKKIDGINVSNW